eukprot:NODE_5575_length_500_cov_305.946785_g4166_i0.p2 GENE.NODE_5575_length_500_cov_305.946785_g4166_i0~~NODE_5575_length_500_cov_305.946785_g4166_i0.p2  ORF type:complete len:139 (-),score=30.78 NODE_5575_length_500_cov_305.946785_g4166_i0:83-448(-)
MPNCLVFHLSACLAILSLAHAFSWSHITSAKCIGCVADNVCTNYVGNLTGCTSANSDCALCDSQCSSATAGKPDQIYACTSSMTTEGTVVVTIIGLLFLICCCGGCAFAFFRYRRGRYTSV